MAAEHECWEERTAMAHCLIVERVRSGDEGQRIEAAREIRRLTKTSSRNRRHLSGAIEPLVSMLRSGSAECLEAALLAILNLAVKDLRNKFKIVEAGALVPLVGLLQSTNSTLQDSATAALLTLTASPVNKQTITAAGVVPILVEILRNGTSQAKIDAAMALYNLSTIPENLTTMLAAKTIPPLISLLKSCRRSSKTAEKYTALLESLICFDEGRDALIDEEGGVLTLVEVLEEGSVQSKELAVGALLTMCKTNRCKYRELILKEGAIPGLLELTLRGTAKSQSNALELLQLLRDSPYPQSQL